MKRSDFQFDLPTELIAREPVPERSASRLLCLDGATGAVAHRRFADLVELLAPGDLLVFNDTRVIPARLFGRKATGGRVEVLIERVTGISSALAHIRASKSPKAGAVIELTACEDGEPSGHELVIGGRQGELFEVEVAGGGELLALLDAIGHMPLPPYIDRPDAAADRERYQTVYAREPGAVAAPTAGLHFDEALLAALAAKGVERAFVTLHVGAGTFQPVRVDDIREHVMHSERLTVSAEVVEKVAAARARGGRVVAVGTTAVRCLETAAASGELVPYSGETDIFIYPGYRFRAVDALITNFHLPESTLIMLVAAFAGTGNVLAAYREAVAERYRFFSYGDAMFVTPASAQMQRGS